MPAKDKTGPRGKGPRTGRGFGNCKPEFTPEDKPKKQGEEFKEDIKFPEFKPGYGLGKVGSKRGRGRGFGPRI